MRPELGRDNPDSAEVRPSNPSIDARFPSITLPIPLCNATDALEVSGAICDTEKIDTLGIKPSAESTPGITA